MNPIRHAGPAYTVTTNSARSRETRFARAVLVSAAAILAVSCADSPLAPAPAAPVDNFLGLAPQYDSVAASADKDAPMPSLSRAASLTPSFSASGAGSLSKIQTVAFAPESGPFVNSVPGCDDCVFGGGDANGYDIGFNFSFYGTSYSKFWVSTNGFIAFQKPASHGCCNGKPVPALDAFNNIIAIAWVDLFPAPGQISFETRGEPGKRRLIVNFDQVLLVNENNKRLTAQLILYEGTNAIEIHTTSKAPLSRHLATQAAENAAGNDAAFVPGRVASNLWAVSNDAVRFSGEQVNAAPVANAGGNAGEAPNKHYAGIEGVAVEFTGSGTDADNDALSYSWDFDNDGTVDATTAAASFTYVDNGTHSALLRVSDGRGGVAESRVDVVIENAAPEVNAGDDLRITAGQSIDLAGQFSDKGAKDHLWHWSYDVAGSGVALRAAVAGESGDSEHQGLLPASKKFCKAGTYSVTLSVTDKDNASGSDEVLVTVDALPVEIAVSPNSINTGNNGHGMITVRIYSREGLDATALRPELITLTNGNGSGTPLARNGSAFHWDASTDLNGDGRLDVSAGFRRDELVANGDLVPGANKLSLSGELGSCGDVLGSSVLHVKEKGR